MKVRTYVIGMVLLGVGGLCGKGEAAEAPLISTVTYLGNANISDQILERHLSLWPGRPYQPKKVAKGQESLYARGVFQSIDISTAATGPNTIAVTVRTVERPARYIRGGAGYGTQSKERVTLGYEDHNFFGGLRQFDLKATYSGFVTHPDKYKTLLLESTLSKPYLFNTPLEGQLNISEEWDDRQAYDSQATTFRASLLHRFTDALNASLRYRFSGTRLTNVSPEADTPDQTYIGALGPTVTYDHTNDRFLPTQGWRSNGTWEEALHVLGSDVGFHKLEGRAGRYDTLAGWTFFEGVQVGELIPHKRDPAGIPIFERYFLGGANTVRGYAERELGPRDEDGNPLGGEAFLVNNIEIRHAIYKKLFGVIFLDAGQLYTTGAGGVWPYINLDQFTDLQYSTGLGFRVNTPVGALRLEFGYQINPEFGNSFSDRTALHFSIGEVF